MEDKLREIGLTEYETKIYLTLLRNGELTGGKVSKLSKVPHGRTYEVLIKLAEKGLVSIIPIKPKLFKVVEPKTAFKNYLNKKITNLEELEKEIPEQLKKISSITPKKETTTERINLIWGTKNIRPLINNNYIKAKKSIKLMFTYEYLSSSAIKNIDDAIKRGVKVQKLATKMTDNGLELMKEDVKRGIEVRYYPVDELRIMIIDGNYSDINVVNPKDLMDRTFIQIQSLELTKALENYFDTIWKKAKTIKLNN